MSESDAIPASGSGSGLGAFHPGLELRRSALRFATDSVDRGDSEPTRRVLSRVPYGEAILQVASRHQIDGFLIAALIEVESAFTPSAVSPRGAVGLMQVMPDTGLDFGVEDLTDPQHNLEVGTRYLGQLLDFFAGDVELALAAYNAGPATVLRYRGVPPYRETREYVERVLQTYVGHHRDARSHET
jgi:soluble lytic murein transglycosylase-like protein